MRRFGELAIEQQKSRVLAGINVQDQPAKPLKATRRMWSPERRRYVDYADYKIDHGGEPIRNMRLTGALLGSMHVTSVGEGRVRAGFTPDQNIKAHKAQETERMFGLSPEDKGEVMSEMRAEFGANLRGAR